LPTGENVFVIGNPLGVLPDTISSGIVSGKRSDDSLSVVQITAAISPGNSGGPVITETGKVAGIVRSHLTEGQSLNMATSIDMLEKIIAKKPIELELFLKNGGRDLGGGITEAPGPSPAPKSDGSAEPMSPEAAKKQAADRWVAVYGNYLKRCAEFRILETRYLDEKWSNETENLRSSCVKVQNAAELLTRDPKLTAAMYALGETPAHLQELDEKMVGLRAKWYDVVEARVAYNYANETRGDAAARRALETLDGANNICVRMERELIALIDKESWVDYDALKAIPPPVWGQRLVFACLDAHPDLDITDHCVFGVIYWDNKKIKSGEELTAMRLKNAKEFRTVDNWRDVLAILKEVDYKGQVVLRLQRYGKTREVTYDLGK
jgi:hypothetical protein